MRYEMKSAKLLLLHLAVCSIVITLSGCAMKTATAEEITIEGVYVKDAWIIPFQGQRLWPAAGIIVVSGERAKDLAALKDKSKIKISGRLYTRNRSIPEAGTFREITEQVIEVTKVIVIGK